MGWDVSDYKYTDDDTYLISNISRHLKNWIWPIVKLFCLQISCVQVIAKKGNGEVGSIWYCNYHFLCIVKDLIHVISNPLHPLQVTDLTMKEQ